ncbi:hypothetical protein [Micromonospora terminaliae]|uniref:hypothetical protein n=1 Tax=Micromonospora terminaliae TaxID=1914461 RepID=UPI001FCC4AA6|nr:hypothetical protein [Micromonospora terminaliae]
MTRPTAVDGRRAALRVPGVLDVQIEAKVGDQVPELLSSAHRSGHLLAWGATPTDAESAARKAAGEIRITAG